MMIPEQKMRQRRLVELNVIEQCLNIFKTAVVQRRRVYTNNEMSKGNDEFKFTEPRVHAFVYEPGTGIAKKLDVDFASYVKDLRDIYDLYSKEEKEEQEEKKKRFLFSLSDKTKWRDWSRVPMDCVARSVSEIA